MLTRRPTVLASYRTNVTVVGIQYRLAALGHLYPRVGVDARLHPHPHHPQHHPHLHTRPGGFNSGEAGATILLNNLVKTYPAPWSLGYVISES